MLKTIQIKKENVKKELVKKEKQSLKSDDLKMEPVKEVTPTPEAKAIKVDHNTGPNSDAEITTKVKAEDQHISSEIPKVSSFGRVIKPNTKYHDVISEINDEPLTHDELALTDDKQEWYQAEREEIQSLLDHNTWSAC
jgi:hypothetical protein